MSIFNEQKLLRNFLGSIAGIFDENEDMEVESGEIK